jgi:hypothetical protein
MKKYYENEQLIKNLFNEWQTTSHEFALASKTCYTLDNFETLAVNQALKLRLIAQKLV